MQISLEGAKKKESDMQILDTQSKKSSQYVYNTLYLQTER